MEDGDDTILALGLGYARGSQHPNHSNQLGLSCKLEPWIPTPSPVEPSLTLGLPDTAYRSPTFKAEARKPFAEAGLARQSSSHSTASSFSKPGSDEPERASGRASDDEEEGSARKKLRLTKQQSALLEDRFKEHSTLNPKQKQALAKKLNLRPRQVEVWFQNRRARTKMKQTEMNCEFLRRYCDSLTEENQRLKNELHELRAIKLASPWYTQFQRAALTVCPSCDRVTGAGECSKGGPPNPKLLNPFTGSAAC